MEKVGFGGSCHWCTEAIFQSLKGVTEVSQGWIASQAEDSEFSEAVIVAFDQAVISLETLVAVHLHTHSCTVEHSLRAKYRSAVYFLEERQAAAAQLAIQDLQFEFEDPIITRVLPFREFKLNEPQYLNYYYSDPDKPFCQNIVSPKLKLLVQLFTKEVKASANNW